MLDIIDTLAVREVIERQNPRRRRICELLMHECNKREVAARLGISRRAVTYNVACIRQDFIAAGFGRRPRGGEEDRWRRKKVEHRKRMRRKRMRTGPKKTRKFVLPT